MPTIRYETGCGILPGEPVEIEVDQAALDAAREREAVTRKIEKLICDEALADEQRRLCDGIDKTLGLGLKRELAIENAERRVTATHQKHFRRFKDCAARWGLPHLPAPPQMVATFLAEENEGGASERHLSRLAKSISVIHRALGFCDPLDDVLPRALLRCLREDTSTTTQPKETDQNG